MQECLGRVAIDQHEIWTEVTIRRVVRERLTPALRNTTSRLVAGPLALDLRTWCGHGCQMVLIYPINS
jgi:hypothetical protein